MSVHTFCSTLSRIKFGTDNLFEYINARMEANTLPTFEELESMASELHRTYSTLRAYERALDEHDVDDPYSVPKGSAWKAKTAEKTSQHVLADKTTKSKAKKNAKGTTKRTEPTFVGDRTLGKSIMIMRELMTSREFAYAVAEGNIGRAYECVKVSGF